MPELTHPLEGIERDTPVLPLDLARAALALATARSSKGLAEALETCSEALPGRPTLVLFRSVPASEESGGGYDLVVRAGGPIGVPSHVPWGQWGPADARRAGGEAAGAGPSPFGPAEVTRLAGPAASLPGVGLGLAVLGTREALAPLEDEVLEVLAEAAAEGLARIRQVQDLARRSLRDPLTGVLNRKALDEVLVREIKRASRPQNVKQTSLLMIDLDDFKEINDRHGHAAGDALLRAVAQSLRQVLRVEDVVARYGGDEFVLLLPETDPTGAHRVGEKVLGALRRIRVPVAGESLRVRASVGGATDPGEPATFDHAPSEEEKHALAQRFAQRIRRLMKGADAALYEAKSAGRDTFRHEQEKKEARPRV